MKTITKVTHNNGTNDFNVMIDPDRHFLNQAWDIKLQVSLYSLYLYIAYFTGTKAEPKF